MMDAGSQRISQEVPLSTARGHVNGGLVVDHSVHPAACAMCRRTFSPDNDDLETISLCGDCNFLLLEDFGTPTRDSRQRTPSRGRRTRYSRSESIENLFSQELSHMVSLVGQNTSTISANEDQSVEGDASARLLLRTSTHTTPLGSRRWRQILSDTDSEGFDNLESLYWENETNLSLSRYRVFHGENDALSFSMYGGDSDASVDGRSILDTEMFIQPDEGSDIDSVSDIDPMHAGLSHWDSDELEEEVEEDGVWDEADTVASVEVGARHQNLFISSPSEDYGSANWRQQFHSPEFEGPIRWRIEQGRQTYSHDIFANLDGSELQRYIGNSGDYLDARGFEEFLGHLLDTDNSRRGAPPAAVSFVNRLPRLIINGEHQKHDVLACAICKDILLIGTEVNQLPCLHLYHPSCILPWLRIRNTCPLCRHELPTDDGDYEQEKQNIRGGMGIHEIQRQDESEDSSDDVSDGAEADGVDEFDQGGMEQSELLEMDPAINNSEGNRRRWFLLAAAAPIVSLVGMVLVLWLGNPQRRGRTRYCNLSERGVSHISGSSIPNQRDNRSRRWWQLF